MCADLHSPTNTWCQHRNLVLAAWPLDLGSEAALGSDGVRTGCAHYPKPPSRNPGDDVSSPRDGT
eukprot:1262664-Pyramimonas_sp.AAC.1